jgi:hypothetical protein
VYHINKDAISSIKNKTVVTSDSIAYANYNYHVKPHFISFNYPAVNHKDYNFIGFANQKILLLKKKGFWPRTDFSEVKTLIISNNFKINAKDLQMFPALEIIVGDGSNNRYSIKKLAELSSKFGIKFHCTFDNGAYVQKLFCKPV